MEYPSLLYAPLHIRGGRNHTLWGHVLSPMPRVSFFECDLEIIYDHGHPTSRAKRPSPIREEPQKEQSSRSESLPLAVPKEQEVRHRRTGAS